MGEDYGHGESLASRPSDGAMLERVHEDPSTLTLISIDLCRVAPRRYFVCGAIVDWRL